MYESTVVIGLERESRWRASPQPQSAKPTRIVATRAPRCWPRETLEDRVSKSEDLIRIEVSRDVHARHVSLLTIHPPPNQFSDNVHFSTDTHFGPESKLCRCSSDATMQSFVRPDHVRYLVPFSRLVQLGTCCAPHAVRRPATAFCRKLELA